MRSEVAKKIIRETPDATKIYVAKYSALVVRIHSYLSTNGKSQKWLADKLGKQPSEVHKWLSGEHNLTLKSICKLEAELDMVLIEVPQTPIVIDFKTACETLIYERIGYHSQVGQKLEETWEFALAK